MYILRVLQYVCVFVFCVVIIIARERNCRSFATFEPVLLYIAISEHTVQFLLFVPR